MGFLSAFGIDWKILAFQLINFAIIYFAFAKLIWPLILKALDKRQKEIAQGLENAKKAKANLATAEEQKNSILSQAKLAAKELLQTTKLQNQASREKFLQDLSQEKVLILTNAANQAKNEKAQILQQAKKELGLALTSSLEKFVTTELDQKQKTALNETFIQALKK